MKITKMFLIIFLFKCISPLGAMQGEVASALELVEVKDDDIYFPDENEETELVRIIRALIKTNGNLNQANSMGNPLLHMAALQDDFLAAKLLIEHGAHWNCKNAQHEIIFHVDSVDQSSKTCRYLEANRQLFFSGYGDEKAIQNALADGAYLHVRYSDGCIPLHMVAARETDRLKELLKAMKNKGVDTLDDNGETPFYRAAIRGMADNMRLLLGLGADLYTQNKEGQTAFHAAVFSEEKEAVQVFIEEFRKAGKSVDITNSKGMTPLSTAVTRNQLEIARMLLQAGANPHFRSNVKDDLLFQESIFEVVHVTSLGYGEYATLFEEFGFDLNSVPVREQAQEQKSRGWLSRCVIC